MYPENNLYNIYIKNYFSLTSPQKFPDITKQFTLDSMSRAINCCEQWGSFLDIGAGSGHYSLPLLFKFKKGTAVEPVNNERLDHIKNKFSNFEVKNDYIQNLSFEGFFDFILMADLFEHIPPINLDSFLAKVSKLQEKGGVVYLMTPNIFFCGPADESEIYYTRHNNGHYRHYTKEEMVSLFFAKGYDLIYANYEEHLLRRKFESVYWSLSRRINNLGSNGFLGVLLWPFIKILHLFFRVASYCIFRNELGLSLTEDNAITVALIFKKIR